MYFVKSIFSNCFDALIYIEVNPHCGEWMITWIKYMRSLSLQWVFLPTPTMPSLSYGQTPANEI